MLHESNSHKEIISNFEEEAPMHVELMLQSVNQLTMELTQDRHDPILKN